MKKETITRHRIDGATQEFRSTGRRKNKRKRKRFWVWVRSLFLNRELRP